MAKRRSSKTSKPNVTRTPRKKVASGSAIGKRSKKMVGCKACNFGTPYVVAEKTSLSTGKPCPRCHSPNSLMTFDVVVDVKGGNSFQVVVSPEAKMKMKWFELEYGIPVTIVGR